MTNEEAIIQGLQGHIEALNETIEKQDKIIKALEQQPSEDCVSRSDVMALIEITNLKHLSVIRGISQKAFEDLLNGAQTLSPVTPTHGTCKDCKYCFIREGNDPNATMCEIQGCAYVDSDFYCKYFDKRGNENG